MNLDTALQVIIAYLKQQHKATDTVLTELIGGDRDLYNKVKEQLIFDDIARDKNNAGLIYCGFQEDHDHEENEAGSVKLDIGEPLKIFLSYGRQDAEKLAKKLEKKLEDMGHEVWLDKSKMRGGKSWEEQIENAILSHDIFISLLTPHAVRRPEGVCLDEISMARFHNRKVLPVMVIQCRPPLSIYRLDWVNFIEWEEEHHFSRSLDRVVQAMYGNESVEGIYAYTFSQLKPFDFGVDIARMTRDFTGREWLFDEVNQWLENSSSRVFFITGDPGIGKSSIMAQLASKHPQVMAYHFCISSLVDSLNQEGFVRSLAGQLSTQLEDYHAAVQQLDFESLSRMDAGTLFRKLLAEPLKSIELNEKVVMLVDALDEAWTSKGSNIVKVLNERLEDLPEQVKIIVSSRDIPNIFDLLSKYSPYKIDPSRIENIKDIEIYLNKRFSEEKIRKKLPKSDKVLSEIKNAAIQKSEGNFLYIRQFVHALEDDQIDINDVSSFPDGLIGIYITFFDRLFSGESEYDEFRSVLEVITCLKTPFSAKELSPLVGITEFEIRRKMENLAAFFTERDGKYTPYHKSITDWLTGSVGKGGRYLLDMERASQKVCDYYLERYHKEEFCAYLLRYLPQHLIEGRMFDELAGLLLDFRFIVQKCQEGLVYDLIKDYRATMEILPETCQSMREEKEYLDRMDEYTRQLVSDSGHVAHAKSRVPSLAPWSDKQIEYRIKELDQSNGTADLFTLFLQFLDAQAHLLYRYGKLDGYVMQQAYNFARTGPFARRVDDYIESCSSYKMLLARELRKRFNPFDPIVRIFQEHSERVHGVSITYDGKYAVTGSNDNSMKLWDMHSGECLKTITPHKYYCKSLDATPDLNLVVSSGGGYDPSLYLWNYRDLEFRGEFVGHTDRVNQVRITPDGRYVISGGNDNTVKVWDTTSMECIADFREHTWNVVSVDISMDGKIGVSVGYEELIYVWDIPGKKCLWVFDDIKTPGYAVKLSPDGKTLFAGGNYTDRSIRSWDLETGKCSEPLTGHEKTIHGLDVTHDGAFLISASSDRTVRIWNLKTQKCIRKFVVHTGPVRCIGITPDMKYIISGVGGTYDNTARVVSPQRSRESWEERRKIRNIRDIHFLPESGKVLLTSRKNILIRDPLNGGLVGELKGHKSHIKKVWVSPEGDRAISCSLDKTIRIWDLQSESELAVLSEHSDGILTMALSRDQKRLVTGGWDEQIIEWDLEQNIKLRNYPGHKSCIEHLAYLHEDKHILSISYDNVLKLWDSGNGACLHTITHPQQITAWSMLDSKDNFYLGYKNGSLSYWNLTEMKEQRPFEGHDDLVTCLVLAEPDQALFSGSRDGMLKQWDLSTGECTAEFKGHTKEIIYIRKFPGENRIITASWDHTLRVWEMYSGRCIGVLTTNLLVTGLSQVQNSGKFAYGTMQGEFNIIDPGQD